MGGYLWVVYKYYTILYKERELCRFGCLCSEVGEPGISPLRILRTAVSTLSVESFWACKSDVPSEQQLPSSPSCQPLVTTSLLCF